MFTLRDYQNEAYTAIDSALQTHDSTLAVLPTGTGKTVVFVELMDKWMKSDLYRCMVICPMITLISQAAKKIAKVTGVFPAIEQGDQWSNESEYVKSPFIVASKQSLCAWNKKKVKRYERFDDIGLVIVDEAHLSITKPYKEMLTHFMNRGAKVVGVTATPKRHDKMAMGQVYQSVAYNYGIKQAMEEGWLVPPTCQIVRIESLDLKDVKTSQTTNGKDFNQKELNAKLENIKTIAEIASVTAKETSGEKTVVFCSSVQEAQMVSERLRDNHGIKSGWICADEQKCSKDMRANLLKSFTDPEGVSHLCNVGILTTGWDYDRLKNIVMARPTQSASLHTQIFGRGTRPIDGTVDFSGSTSESRREAIANSDKPTFRFIDLVDSSLNNKIITSMDVLGGNYSDVVRQKAKKKYLEGDDQTGFNPDEILEIVDEEERKRLQEEQEKRERYKRAQLEAEAKYGLRTVSPFTGGVSQRDAKPVQYRFMPSGKHKDKALTELPQDYIMFLLNRAKTKPKKPLRDSLVNELRRRAGRL